MQIAISVPGSTQAPAPGAAGLAELAGLPIGDGTGVDGLGLDPAAQTDAQAGFAAALAGALFTQAKVSAPVQTGAAETAPPPPAPALPLTPALQVLTAQADQPAAPANPAAAASPDVEEAFQALLSQFQGVKAEPAKPAEAATVPAPAPAQIKADIQPAAPAAVAAPVAVAAPNPPPTATAPSQAPAPLPAPTAETAEQAAAAIPAPAVGDKPLPRGAARADAARQHGRPDVRGEGDPGNTTAQAASGKSTMAAGTAQPIGAETPLEAIDPDAAPAKTDVAQGQDQPDAPAAPLPAQTAATQQAGAAVKAEPATFVHLASQIVQKLAGKVTRFDLELMPHGLGKVDVRIEISASGALSAALSFDSPQAAAELRGRAEELKAALQQAGFDLGDKGLSFDLSGGQQRWAEDRREDARAFAGRAFAAAADAADDILATTVAEAAARLQRRGADAGLDIRI